MNHRTVTVMLILGLAALSSVAELQGVILNGTYNVKGEDRLSRVIQTFNYDNPDPSVPAIRIRFGEGRLASYGGDWAEEVAIPAHEARRDFPDQMRTFLCFYARASEPNVRGDLVVFVGGYPAYSGQMTGGGWQPLLVDLSPWNGKSVRVRIHASMSSNPGAVVLALPRLVTWFGPYYAGSGGLSGPTGPHGMPYASGAQVWNIRAGSLTPDQLLLVLRFDVLTPAIVQLESARDSLTATMGEGFHWLPVAVGADSEVRQEVLDGVVERGQVDLIPNFMGDDKKALEHLEPLLSAPSSS